MRRIVAICMLLSSAALAQPAPPGPPMEGQRPPGFNPAPPAAAQPVRPPSEPPGANAAARVREPEWLVTRNSANMPAWVSLSSGRLVQQAGCVAPNAEMRWAIYDPKMPLTIKAELTRDAACKPPPNCVATIDRRPGMATLDLRTAGPNCAWSVAPPKPILKAVIDCCVVENSTKYSMWVTAYEGVFRRITRTACVKPNDIAYVHVDQLAWMRAEVTRNPNCAQPVGCDTTMDVGGGWTGGRDNVVTLKPANWAPGGGCWWESRCVKVGGCK